MCKREEECFSCEAGCLSTGPLIHAGPKMEWFKCSVWQICQYCRLLTKQFFSLVLLLYKWGWRGCTLRRASPSGIFLQLHIITADYTSEPKVIKPCFHRTIVIYSQLCLLLHSPKPESITFVTTTWYPLWQVVTIWLRASSCKQNLNITLEFLLILLSSLFSFLSGLLKRYHLPIICQLNVLAPVCPSLSLSLSLPHSFSISPSLSGVCGCCGALRPRYKRLVDNIFPEDPEVRCHITLVFFSSFMSMVDSFVSHL